MSNVFRPDEVPVRSREEYWRHVVGDVFGRVELHGELADGLVVGDVGPLRVVKLWHHRPGGASRTARHARLDDVDLCKLDVIAHGRGVIGQNGRQASLRAGDLTFVDLSRPASWAMSQVQLVGVVFPRTLLPMRPNDVARLTAVRIPGDYGTGALISTLARQLVGHLDEYRVAGSVGLGAAVLDLLTVSLATQLDRTDTVPPDTRQRALLARIHAFIEGHLGDPELSPDTIAAAHYISTRRLYKLFEAEGWGVAGWIRKRRLNRTRRDLLDPALRTLSVSSIAARWGFTNPAYFNRIFREIYGLPPGQYRMRANGSDPLDGTPSRASQ